jgi:hypothetical protein
VAAVWPLIGEAKRWRDWSWMTKATLVHEGDPPPDGVGALRRFGVGPGGSKERVVAWDPPHHLGYVMVSGLPVRHYRADVTLTEDDGGTRVTWRCSVEPLVPGTGGLLAFVLGKTVHSFAVGVCRYADKLAAESG